MDGHVPNQIALVSERLVTRRTHVSFFFRRRRYIVFVVIQIVMALQQLFLSERLVTLLTLVGFLVGMNQHVRLQVSGADRGVRAELTLEAFFAVMGFNVQFIRIPIGEHLVAAFTRNRSVSSVQFHHMNP